MKLEWKTSDNVVWRADFGGFLTLRVDFNLDNYGIYDGDDPVWRKDIEGEPDWCDLAEIVERELSCRLWRMSETLDASYLEPSLEYCQMCGCKSDNLHRGFVEGDCDRCPPCLEAFVSYVAAERGLVKRLPATYGVEHPQFTLEAVNEEDKKKGVADLVNKYYTECIDSYQIDKLPFFGPQQYFVQWNEKPMLFEEPPSTQVADSIAAEAKTVKL